MRIAHVHNVTGSNIFLFLMIAPTAGASVKKNNFMAEYIWYKVSSESKPSLPQILAAIEEH